MDLEIGFEGAVRRALGNKFKNYSSFEVCDSWDSHHAQFVRFSLTKKSRKGKTRRFVAKHFIPVGAGHETAYALCHDPTVLFPREKRNLELVGSVVKNTLYSPHALVPRIWGFSERDSMLVMNYLDGVTQRDAILRVARSGSDIEMDYALLNGIRLIARFSGLCSAFFKELQSGFDYAQDLDFSTRSSSGQLKENLARLFYINNPQLAASIGEYDYSRVFDYLLQQKRINLDFRVSELTEKSKKLNEKIRFQHNDCNGLNIVGNTVLDLEKFGLGPATADISSYCTIVGLGNTAILRRGQFNLYRHAFLAYEYAWEQRDKDLISKLNGYYNGQFRDFVGDEIMTQNEYADWTMSFFARVIEKNIQLGATYNRYSPAEQRASSGAVPKVTDHSKIDNYLQELFLTVHGLSSMINDCTNSSGVRDYFYLLGKTMQDLGYSVPDQLLSDIQRGGGIATAVIEEAPRKFKSG
ncbi:MAG: hypothetical protein V2A62_03225 [Candidatus Woesearchaeota archaeon]